MRDSPELELDRRRLLSLAGLAAAGGLTWDVVRGAGDAAVTGPEDRPETNDESIAEYVHGSANFGFELLAELVNTNPGENLLISPLSLSSALAMTWAGARGETERRMRETLHFPHGQDRLHAAVGALQHDLDQRGEDVQHRKIPQVWNVNRFELRLANALWGQADYPYGASFRDTLARNYGSELQSVDFRNDPASARQRINRWGEQASGSYVEELVPPDAIHRDIVLVLVNAVYLRADWQQPFDPDDTSPGEFTRTDGSTVEVPMMRQEGEFSLLPKPGPWDEEGVPHQVVELPYVGGDVSMVLAVPRGDYSLADLERAVDADWLASRFTELDNHEPDEVKVRMPRFTFQNDLELTNQLKALGMTTAFDAEQADFTGMTDPPSAGDNISLDWVIHDTHVAVDEEGTVAVAVSAVGAQDVSAPPSITLDRPFLFCIRDRETDAVLFLGRVVDPGKS